MLNPSSSISRFVNLKRSPPPVASTIPSAFSFLKRKKFWLSANRFAPSCDSQVQSPRLWPQYSDTVVPEDLIGYGIHASDSTQVSWGTHW